MFQPLHDHILVKPIKRRQSAILEVISGEKFNRGLVVATGPGERIKTARREETGAIREMQVAVGDFVIYVDLDHIYPKYFEGETEYRILQDKDVCGICPRESVDEFGELSDAEISKLIALHNRLDNRYFIANPAFQARYEAA